LPDDFAHQTSLTICGEGPLKPYLEELAQGHQHVKIPGYLSAKALQEENVEG
jgi:hypothetical protein